MWSGNNRAKWHDYKSRCIYHITLMKAPGCSYFGHLAGNCNIMPGNPGSPYLVASATGKAIKDTLRRLPEIHPALRLYQYALMPDHLHMLLSVEAVLDENLGKFKVMTNNILEQGPVFERGYNDQIIGPNRKLDQIYRYLRENPYRLAVRRAHPESFRRLTTLEIEGKPYSAYGNLQLLDNPFKEQIVVHRADDYITKERNKSIWLHCAANGGVLVSPFISKAEKAIRAAAEEVDGRIILITDHPLNEREKPAAHDFAQCMNGKLLILTPLSDNLQSLPARQRFLTMNEHAHHIAMLQQCPTSK